MTTSEIGSQDYRAYVGPAEEYDLMGAMQFRLLTALGLRANHRLLDVGCGSLRAGRLFMTYLNPGCYAGIEPNAWLVEVGIREGLGADFVKLKQPAFSHSEEFAAPPGNPFDFVLAQSIFSHTGPVMTRDGLRRLTAVLQPSGLLVITFNEGSRDDAPEGWLYPGCTVYRRATVARFLRATGLHFTRLPWFHPRQVWYVLSQDRTRLPNRRELRYLTGRVVNVPTWRWTWRKALVELLPTSALRLLRSVRRSPLLAGRAGG